MLDSRPRLPSLRSRFLVAVGTTLFALLMCALFLPFQRAAFGRSQADSSENSKAALWPISIDYPLNDSIFPPGITPPTFLWRDAAADSWQIDIVFADNSAPLHVRPKAERMHVGAIDPECVSGTNEPPTLTPEQAASWTWTPDAATWQAIESHSVESPATVTVTGYQHARGASSRGAHFVVHLGRSGGRADLLSGCAADAERRRQRDSAAVVSSGYSSDSLAAAGYSPARRAAQC